ALGSFAQEAPGPDVREVQMRDRYEQALKRNPFQEQAFEKVYAGYLEFEGLEAWAKKLEEGSDDAQISVCAAVGEYYGGNTEEAVAALESAAGAPGLMHAHLEEMAEILEREGRYETALAVLERIG